MKHLEAFCVSEKVSGGELYCLELLGALERLGWSCSLVTGNNQALVERAASVGIRTSEIRLGPKLGKKTLLRTLCTWPIQLVRFNAHIKAGTSSVVLLQYKLEQLLSAMISMRKVTVILEHGPIPSLITRITPVRYLYIRALSRANLVLAASRPAQEALKALGVDSSLLLAGDDPRRVASAIEGRDKHRVLLEGFVDVETIGVYAGRIVANKGVFDAMSMVSELNGVGLVFFGDGPDAELLQARTADMPNVHFVGPISDPLPYIAAADFGILLTKDPGEGRPLFGVECMSVGTPLIAGSGSAAIDGLVEQFGSANVRVMPALTPVDLKLLIEEKAVGAIPSRNWEDAASDFLRFLELATNKAR